MQAKSSEQSPQNTSQVYNYSFKPSLIKPFSNDVLGNSNHELQNISYEFLRSLNSHVNSRSIWTWNYLIHNTGEHLIQGLEFSSIHFFYGSLKTRHSYDHEFRSLFWTDCSFGLRIVRWLPQQKGKVQKKVVNLLHWF